MKRIEQYIKESVESDNLLWLLDKWFDMHDEEKKEFMEIVFQCQNDHTVNNLEKYLNQTMYIKNNYKEFISFLMDEVHINKDIDYMYQLKEMIKSLIGNKSNKNKYIK